MKRDVFKYFSINRATVFGSMPLARILTVFISIFFMLKGNSLNSQVPASDKYYLFSRNHPSDATPSWGDAAWATGALAHDDLNFYIGATSRTKETGKTNNDNWQIWRWPVSEDLDQDLDYGERGVITFNLKLSTTTSERFRNYGHIGDMDCFKYNNVYYLAIPLTSKTEGHDPIVAFFSAKDLKFINYSYLDSNYQENIGWCAVNPVTLDLYTSRDDADSIIRYNINWEKLFDRSNHRALEIDTFYNIPSLPSMQGGEFTPDGKLLYVSCGLFDCFGDPRSYPSDGIHVFDTFDWRRIQRSTNPERREDGCFNFSFDNRNLFNQCYQEEPEGLTIWDMDKVPGHHPSINGQLHVLLDDHNPYIWFTSSSTLSIRHFKRSEAVNDECSNAKTIQSCDKVITNNYYAHPSNSIPAIQGYSGPIEDVWYKINPAPHSSFSIETYQVPDGLTNTVMQLLTGTCGNLREIKSDDNSGDGNHAKITISNYSGNNPVYIRITDYSGDNYGKFGILYKTLTPGSTIFSGTQFFSGEGPNIHQYPALTGDVNGDGRTDLIFIPQDWNGNTNLNVRVKMSNGDGSFTARSQVLGDGNGVHDYPALTGDVNGDGKTDLIFIGQDWGGNTNLNVRVKMSNGDGSFKAYSQTFSDGNGIHDYPAMTGDINGDGKTDLIFVGQDWGGNTNLNVRVKMSNGDGTFKSYSQVLGDGKGIHDYPALTGDVNGDGKTDLIFIGQDWDGNTNLNVRVKMSNGDGTFKSYSQVFSDGKGIHDYPALTGDVNGDGRTDLIFVGQDWGGNTNLNVRVKMSNGDGSFKSYSQVLGDGKGVHDYPTLTGDVNGDGKTDLIFVGQNWTSCGLNIRVKLSNGDGTWCPDWQVTGDGSTVLDYPVLTGDINNDHKTDLLFVFDSEANGLEIRTKITQNNYTCNGRNAEAIPLIPPTSSISSTSTSYQIFPNPTGNYIRISTINPELLRVTLINSQGIILHNYNLFNTSRDKLDLSSFQNGIYFIHIFNERTGEMTTRKIIKNNN